MTDTHTDPDYEVALTTLDNPYDPLDEMDEWWAFDVQRGYHTWAYLARVARTSDSLSDADNLEAIEQAIDEIVDANITGNYLKVKRKVQNIGT